MKEIKQSVILALFLGLAATSSILEAQDFTGTPTQYEVQISKLEAYNGTNWVTISDNSLTFDMGTESAENAGDVVGNYISNGNIEPGTYTQMRITVNKTFAITGTGDRSGTTFYTKANGTATTAAGAVSASLTPPDSVDMPDGVTDDGTNFVCTENISFTIQEGVSQTLTLSFDVSDKLLFFDVNPGVTAAFYPNPPVVTVTVN